MSDDSFSTQIPHVHTNGLHCTVFCTLLGCLRSATKEPPPLEVLRKFCPRDTDFTVRLSCVRKLAADGEDTASDAEDAEGHDTSSTKWAYKFLRGELGVCTVLQAMGLGEGI